MKKYVYSTVADSKAEKYSIGYLNPGEGCTCFDKVDGDYFIAYLASASKEIGFALYAGGGGVK